jgi:curved DNA-binding protein CbpA
LATPNYYEFLQISPNADSDTIHRVYKFLAARFHPDNPESGDADKFFLLRQAYEVLSHPATRAKYDSAFEQEASQQPPLSTSIDFMDDIEGELNRRLAVLALLYARRRTNPAHPEVSLAEVETRMGFPRDYLEFTMWYLQKKSYITRADNSAFTLTADGVDFVESQRGNIPMLNKLLTSGNTVPAKPQPAAQQSNHNPIIVPPSEPEAEERRRSARDRRSRQPDMRSIPIEQRTKKRDRRATGPELNATGAEGRTSEMDQQSRP